MTALLLANQSDTENATTLRRRALAGDEESHDEKWLQKLLFDHPELVPLGEMEPDGGTFLPLTREMPLPRSGGSVFPDLLGVTRSGRLVIVECKLWRNPQARREVIAQITEYAALLRRWSFTDFSERLKQKEGWTGANPLFDRAKALWPEIRESVFVDAITRSLANGDFHLLIVGDGIRTDLMAIVDHLAGTNAGLSRLGLIEIQLWSDTTGRVVVLPRLAVRTEVLVHRVLVSESGQPVSIDPQPIAEVDGDTDVATERTSTPMPADKVARFAANRAFWQRFIDEVRFQHVDQPPPRHGGNNTARIAMPGDAPWLTAYRIDAEIGLFIRLKGETGRLAFLQFESEAEALRAETGLDLTFPIKSDDPFEGQVWVHRKRSTLRDEEDQLDWVKHAADKLVSSLRPRLKGLYTKDV